MTELRYRWVEVSPQLWVFHEPQDNPAPPKSTYVHLLLADHIVFEGDVTDQLRAWARWCALQVAHLWDCPSVVRQYLETGDRTLSRQALDVAEAHHSIVIWDSQRVMIRSAMWSARLDLPAHKSALAASGSATTSVGVLHALMSMSRQERHLRRLLLQRALPEPRWPLIDGADGVLHDALLEGR